MKCTGHIAEPFAPASPALTRNALSRLRDRDELSVSAWEKALELCGFVPDRRDWFAYWRRIFLLAGALLFLAGVIFFIAWNWAEMHRFLRMALVGLLVAVFGLGSLVVGFDTGLGRVLLLSCGIAVGPMLAVFGQTYQSGAELWELFRAWTAILIMLAAIGRQPALWFVTWLAGNAFVMLWLGRNMAGPLEAFGMFNTLPESLLVLALAVAAWEWGAWKFRKRAAFSWLESRWLPRLLFFNLVCGITVYLILQMFGALSWAGWTELFLPRDITIPLLAFAVAGASWHWHRIKMPDLFMLAVVLASLVVLFVALLIKAKFLFDGDVGAVFVWGLLITGLTAGLGKALLHLQRSMKDAEHAMPRPPRSARAFFGFSRQNLSWEHLWAQLQSLGYLAPDTLPPSPEEPGPPWYVRCLLALGGWIAALLFMIFLVLLLFWTLQIRTDEGRVLFFTALPVLAVGGMALRRSGMFPRHFGFALALAGTGCAVTGIFIMVEGTRAGFFLVSAFILVACAFVRSDTFRFLGALAIACCVATGFANFGHQGSDFWLDMEDVSHAFFAWTSYAQALWWAVLSLGFAVFCLKEKVWRGTAKGRIAEPMFYGMYAGMLVCQILAFSFRFGNVPLFFLFPGGAREVAFGASAGLIYFAWELVKARNDAAERGFVMFCAGASLPLAWFLPGAAPAFFGLAIARFIGNAVMQGTVAAYFFVYMIYYYYFLGVPLLTKSLLLAGTGILLLLFSYCLGRYARGMAGEEADHA